MVMYAVANYRSVDQRDRQNSSVSQAVYSISTIPFYDQ
jgi:hypothetical protein